MKLIRQLLRERPQLTFIVGIVAVVAIVVLWMVYLNNRMPDTPEVEAFESHYKSCAQCSDVDQGLCEEGFALLQAALKSDPDYEPDDDVLLNQ